MDEPIFGKLVTIVDMFIYLTLFTNLLCTGLISYKIFNIRRNVSGAMSSRSDGGITARIITIILESAAGYTLLLVAQLIANNLDSYVTYILMDMTPPIIVLVFSYIIIRVSRGSAYGDSSGHADTSLSWERGNNVELSGTRSGRSGTRSEVKVRLERITIQHHDAEATSKDEETASNKYGNSSVV